MADLMQELRSITISLEENDIEYAVCGGLALTILGFPRATFDIDVLIREESQKMRQGRSTISGTSK
jgi:hypothetical protein